MSMDDIRRGINRPFKTDIDNNELRATMKQSPEWRNYQLRDVDGFYTDPFEFVSRRARTP